MFRMIAAAISGIGGVSLIGLGLTGTLLLSWGACTPEGNPPLTMVWIVIVFGGAIGLFAAAIKVWPEGN